jgi:hypothetical protein
MSHKQLRVLVELDPFDGRLLDAQQCRPQAYVTHAVLRSLVLDLSLDPPMGWVTLARPA